MRSCILCENARSACRDADLREILRNSEEKSNSLRKDQHNGQERLGRSRRVDSGRLYDDGIFARGAAALSRPRQPLQHMGWTVKARWPI